MEVEERPISNPTVSRTHRITFGMNVLWLDCVDNYSRTDTWLELHVDNVEKAIGHLATKGVATQNELEEIPENMHWITDPAGNVYLVTDKE